MADDDLKTPLPSVLDRLIDDDPDSEREAPLSPGAAFRILRDGVTRDLEGLLNTRLRPTSWPRELGEMRQSVIGYGLPDISTVGFGTDHAKDEICTLIEQQLRSYEPRFTSISVAVLPNADELDRTLRIRIRAEFKVDTATDTIELQSVIDPVSRQLSVTEA